MGYRDLSIFFISFIISLAVLTAAHTFQYVKAQTTSTPSLYDAASLLVEDVIQDLKANDNKKAIVHLNILNQQLTTLGNSSSIQSVKVLTEDAINALKTNDNNSAIIHLNLAKQQLTPFGVNTMPLSSIGSGNSLINSAASAQPTKTKIFNLTLDGNTFPIHYAITGQGNILHNISKQQDNNTLAVRIGSQSNGQFTVEIPKKLMDSPYQVYVNGIHQPTQQITNNSEVRALAIDFPKGSDQIDIQNTDIVNAKTVGLTIDGTTFPIMYNITGDVNSLIDISPGDSFVLLLNIEAQSSGDLILELPRKIIDSSRPYYGVENTGHYHSNPEIKNDANVRILEVEFAHGTSQIGIDGDLFTSRAYREEAAHRYTGPQAGVPVTSARAPAPEEPTFLQQNTSQPSTVHHVDHKSKRGEERGGGGPVGGYDTGFAAGAQRAGEAVNQFDNGQLKGIDADKSPPCPAVDEGNGYCRGFHDGWRKTVLDRLD